MLLLTTAINIHCWTKAFPLERHNERQLTTYIHRLQLSQCPQELAPSARWTRMVPTLCPPDLVRDLRNFLPHYHHSHHFFSLCGIGLSIVCVVCIWNGYWVNVWHCVFGSIGFLQVQSPFSVLNYLGIFGNLKYFVPNLLIHNS